MNRIIDYYVHFSLNRNMSTKEIKNELLKKQGEVRSNMTHGSLNRSSVLNELQKEFELIAMAIKWFRNDDRRKKYDKELDLAYKEGKINIEAQRAAAELFEKLEELFMKGYYSGVIKKGMEAINNNIIDYRIYVLIAQSYYALNESDKSIETVNKGLQVYPGNMQLLKAGARFSCEGKQDYDMCQNYINQMMELEIDNSLAKAEQIFLYLKTGKEDLAYELVDSHIGKYPDDKDFRKNVAYDLVGHSFSYYTLSKNGAYVIASEEDYQKCLNVCEKSLEVYRDENTLKAYNNAKSFGEVKFNEDNKEAIFWLFMGGVTYFIIGIVSIISFAKMSGRADMKHMIAVGIFGIVLGVIVVFSGIMLRYHSYRPYWQINKFELTGKREKGEKLFIIIGNVFTGYLKWGLRLGMKLVRFLIGLAIHR